eukprot:s11079_g2.t1
MLPYALLCANHMLSEFYDVCGVFSEYYKEETRNGTQNTENQESESLEPGYAPRNGTQNTENQESESLEPGYAPRSLELFHNILNYRFAQNKGIAENILEYEEKIELEKRYKRT